MHDGARTAERESTARVATRYALYQAPGWLLAAALGAAAVEWAGVAPWVAAGAGALWVAKDVALFPFVRRAYERDRATHGRVGDTGIALTAIDVGGDGWVRIGAERWRARLAPDAPPIAAGTEVRVTAVEGLVVRIAPAPNLP